MANRTKETQAESFHARGQRKNGAPCSVLLTGVEGPLPCRRTLGSGKNRHQAISAHWYCSSKPSPHNFDVQHCEKQTNLVGEKQTALSWVFRVFQDGPDQLKHRGDSCTKTPTVRCGGCIRPSWLPSQPTLSSESTGSVPHCFPLVCLPVQPPAPTLG